MTNDRLVQAAARLHLLGVSKAGVVELLSQYDIEAIEAQLDWMPHRKAKRPGAFIVEAIRNNYSPPKELFYAKTQEPPASPEPLLDQGSQPSAGHLDADLERHGAASAPDDPPANYWLEPGGQALDLLVPKAQDRDRERE